MSKNTVLRLLVFGLGVPLFILVVIFAPFARNILLVLLVLTVQALSVREMTALLAARSILIRGKLVTALSVSLGIITYIVPIVMGPNSDIGAWLMVVFASAILLCLVMLAPIAFTPAEGFEKILSGVSGGLLAFFYCGILGSLLIAMASYFTQSAAAIFTFTLMTFGNDSLAWLTGMTLGKRRGIIAVSPAKSSAGFAGGMAGSIAAGALSYIIFPLSGFSSVFLAVLMGGAIGVATIIGDLVESAFKRSAGVKDSSTLVPGRGGVLDSFDSLLFSAPIFLVFSLLFGLFQS